MHLNILTFQAITPSSIHEGTKFYEELKAKKKS
jgi:hypothetical protein